MLSKREDESKGFVIVKASEEENKDNISYRMEESRKEAAKRATERKESPDVPDEPPLSEEEKGEDEPEEKPPSRQQEEERRKTLVKEYLYQELQMFYTDYPEMDFFDMMQEVMMAPSNALIDTLGLSEDIEAHDTDIEDEMMDNPVITPAMAEFFNEQLGDEGGEGLPEEIKRFATANTDSESFNFHTGLTDEFKVPRPDMAFDALRYKRNRRGDDEKV